MIRRAVLATLSILAIAAIPPAPARSQSPLQRAAQAARAVRPYHTEQEFLAREIVATVARSAIVGAPQTLTISVTTQPASEHELLTAATLHVMVNDRELVVPVTTHLWAPETWEPLARELLGPGEIAHGPADADAWSLVSALTSPTVDTLLREEARVSQALDRRPRDPVAHDDAALLCAVLAMRETAGTFSDVRRIVSMATARLAMSRALAPAAPPSPSGRVAAIVVSLLAGRDDLASRALTSWTSTRPEAAAWRRALELRLGLDWRSRAPGEKATLLERLEYARALQVHVAGSALLAYVDDQEDTEATWHRLVLHNDWTGFTIEAGHRFVAPGLAIEFAEAERVWRAYHEGTPTRAALLASLNDESPRSARAIDWPTWAGALQRHLSSQVTDLDERLRDLGLKGERAEQAAAIAKEYGGLRLYPFIQRRLADDEAQYHAAAAAIAALQQARPDAVTALQSHHARMPRYDAKPFPFPPDAWWFTPHVLTGTAFDLDHRPLVGGCPRPVPLSIVARWASMRPNDMWTQWSLAWLRAPGKPSFDDVRKALGATTVFDTRGPEMMLRELDGTAEQFQWAGRTICALDVDRCAWLGARLVNDAKEAEAVEVYSRYAELARDRVGVSNAIGWLVHRLWDTGQHSRARALAEGAASTRSGSGINLLGYVFEREGRLEDAQQMYELVVNKYGKASGGELARFCVRRARATKDDTWLLRVPELLPDVFPKGVERAETAWLPAPPKDGMVFTSFGRRALASGLRATDIVVAVDGFRVRSNGQYGVLAHGSFEPRATFTVWRDDRYHEVDVTMPERWLGVGLDTYPSATPPRIVK